MFVIVVANGFGCVGLWAVVEGLVTFDVGSKVKVKSARTRSAFRRRLSHVTTVNFRFRIVTRFVFTSKLLQELRTSING